MKCQVNYQLKGKCRTKNMIYKCLVPTLVHPDKAYLGTIEAVF